MTDKEKIREFLVGMADADCCVTQVAKAINKTILPYIDSLREEPVSEDMEAEFFRAVHNLREQPTLSAWFRHFYNLGKHQMMKDAVEGYVDMLEFPEKTWIELSAIPKDLKDGDKVKLTIIKEYII